MMDKDIAPTVPGFTPAQLDAYKSALIERYRNPALKHRTAQISMDGSQKIPQRLMNTARDRLAAGQSIGHIATALAGFLRFMTGTGETGAALPINDPMAPKFAAAAAAAGATGIARVGTGDEAAALAARLAPAMLGLTDVFGETGRDPRVARPVEAALARLYLAGARTTIAEAST